MAQVNLGRDNIAIKGVWLYVTDQDDRAVTDIFADLGMPDPKSVSLHIDRTYRNMKLFAYLSDVEERHGPFQYVIGSHRIETSDEELAIRITLDRLLGHKTDLESRRFICALPAGVRRKGHFGNDLIDDHPDVPALLAAERKILSRDGDIILFDNGGIHRGALATKGERIALQILLR